MDHYETLGLSRDASKEEIKESFRRSALSFHPDRHAQSSEEVRGRAILRFRRASEAYEVLIDDRKRADYDSALRRHGGGFGWASPAAAAAAAADSAGYGRGGYRRRSPGLDVGCFFRFMTARGFLFSLAFASLLVGAAVVAERSVDTLWKMNNNGKSFEDAMESIEKVRVKKEN